MNLIITDLIKLDVVLETKAELFQYLADILLENRRITSSTRFKIALEEREEIITTGVGDSLAIPHAKDTSVLFPSLVVLRLKKPLEYQSLDNKPVELVFCIAMPEAYHKEHLQLLAKVSTCLMNQEHVKSIKETNQKEDIIRILGI